MLTLTQTLQYRLQKAPYWVVTLFGALSSFAVYSCMYAYRKPFAAATFGELTWLGIDFKVWLILAQTVGYTISKFYGIRLIAELAPEHRSKLILVLIFAAWASLLGFALAPPPINIIFLLLNGLPLGIIWGIVFSFLEGRRTTELMGAFLSVSFIISSGFAKTVGRWVLLDLHVSPFWMPFVSGLFFFPALCIALWCLGQLPQPTHADKQLRSQRLPMNRESRKLFIKQFFTGIFLLVIIYIFLTALRDFRDNFAVEIWRALGYEENPAIFTITEIPIAVIVLILLGTLVLVKKNYKAFMINHVMIFMGIFILFLANLLFRHHLMGPVWWMMLIGTGLYMAYIPFNCLLFERLIATYRYPGNVGFIMYIADSAGYLGSVSILFYKELGSNHTLSWLNFYSNSINYLALVAMLLVLFSAAYFRNKYFNMKTYHLSSYGV